jgi:DNA-binding response OmpR family regulator
LHIEKNRKILVIEDDNDIRVMLSFILGEDYDVVLCQDGRSGISSALVEKPDLILLDIYMAGMSGLEVCRIVRGTTDISSIPIILLTAGAMKDEVAEALANGADDIVFKPFDTVELMQKIEKLL